MAWGRNGEEARGRFSNVTVTGAGRICANRNIRGGGEGEQEKCKTDLGVQFIDIRVEPVGILGRGLHNRRDHSFPFGNSFSLEVDVTVSLTRFKLRPLSVPHPYELDSPPNNIPVKLE